MLEISKIIFVKEGNFVKESRASIGIFLSF
jgi:hypothetical protein